MACPDRNELLSAFLVQSRKTSPKSESVVLHRKPQGLPESEEGQYVRWAQMPMMPYSLQPSDVYDFSKFKRLVRESPCVAHYRQQEQLKNVETVSYGLKFYLGVSMAGAGVLLALARR